MWLERRGIVELSSEIGLPAIHETADFVEVGGLMAYGASLVDMSRRAAGYIDRIVKGAKPAELPVQQPTKFELVINMKTAKALSLTIPPSVLWGVGTTAPYGHDGRSINLTEVILRHGGEAQAERDAFAALAEPLRGCLLDFLNSLILFPPDDTASNLNPANRQAAGFPQFGHGSIKLSVLFNDPNDPE
jgi:hypothetical protein